MIYLDTAEWTTLQSEHIARAKSFTAAHLERRKAGKKHPVFDFLFEYYPIRAAHLERWHPGIGVAIFDPVTASQQAGWKYYHNKNQYTCIDIDHYRDARRQTLTFIRDLLSKTEQNQARFDCFGLHEWAMVYQTDSPRHSLPLRLGAIDTQRVVEENSLRCTHFDAFRFFTPSARPLNLTVLSREKQPETEQRGCVHATMDLYKWAAKLGPIIAGSLWLDTFELAQRARILDMEASPYDCREFGLGVVAIETTAGKQEYVERQRALSYDATKLRDRLVSAIDHVFALH
ncbi:hypothetical protein CMUST_07840 [Corynebacterium mustelae]|uniref:3-methyladenine DNA glycosylase n=1 Tax=Corynebacterium mustelae TaxID=571915 RepID=A0A0G3H240_9CORY|nr:hypothetical protein [Corynebacterium mustelae]AKK05893.1 hypothetical protein CMUST_07840 [Corynebacterium mustelae]